MSVKEIKSILDHRFNRGNWDINNVTSYELDEFANEFMEIKALKEKYLNGNCNRKELGAEISKRAANLTYLANIFVKNLDCDSRINDYEDSLNDFDIVMKILIHLASDKEEYIIKSFSTQAIGSLETQHGDRETGLFQGEIKVIGKKSVLDAIDNTKPYFDPRFRDLAEKTIRDGNSLVIITNHYYADNVLPYYCNKEVLKTKFSVYGLSSDLCCYTYDDELRHAVLMLDQYIKYYGGNFKNLSIDTVVERIDELEKDNTKTR